jgi:hypothetical protein
MSEPLPVTGRSSTSAEGRSGLPSFLWTHESKDGEDPSDLRIYQNQPESLYLLANIRGEADRPALRDGWVHELADGSEDGGDSFIVDGELFVEPGFELCEAPGQLLVRSEHLAQLYEGAHHVDAHFDGARRAGC